jgi:uncharacterized protein (DUF1684 family)
MINFIRFHPIRLASLLVLVLLGGCAKKSPPLDPTAYRHEIEEWQKLRHDRLLREDGWLTLCGLSWLKEGENIVGNDSTSAVVLPPGKTPAVVGSIFLERGVLRFHGKKGAGVTLHDSVITDLPLHHDQEKDFGPTILRSGTVSFQVIKRSDQFGVRVKDKDNPARVNFKGLDYFPIDSKWRIEAKFEPYRPPKVIQIASMINTVESDSCPGALVFAIGDTTCRLDVVIESGNENELFIMFGDATNGKETYGNGRQLYSALPDSAGNVILDFNKAYNWPCVFTVYATCPIPPKQNRLPVRIEAGEKMYSVHP